jgi:hypothetical protein
MHHAESFIAFRDCINNDPESDLVIDLLKRDFLGDDFFIN